ncbi:MAG: VOC family protein [Pseudomonadota bacterium]
MDGSILSHVSIGSNKLEQALNFYDQVLAVLGISKKHDIVIEEKIVARAYGKAFPEFWVQTPGDDKAANCGNGSHFGFIAASKAEVHEFYDIAIKKGAICVGPPGPRPHYGEPYYGCFVYDLDGHKIEAVFWDEDTT